jgi:hypothetical protein
MDALETLFPLGDKVLLRTGPDSQIGQVIGHESGRALVYWPLWGRAGRYKTADLERVNA